METRPGTDTGAGYNPSTSTPPEKASVIEDFLDIFHAPSKVFARRADGGYGLQLLIVSLLAAGFAFSQRALIAQLFDIEFTRATTKAMADNPRLTQDMMNTARPMQEAFATFATYIGTPIFIFILAFFVWLVAKIFTKVTYAQAATIVTLAWIPRLVGSLITTIQAVLMDTSTINSFFALSLSPARFIDPDTANPKVFALAGSIEVFSIWFYILVAIGLSVVGKVPRSKGYIIAAILFVVGSLPALLR